MSKKRVRGSRKKVVVNFWDGIFFKLSTKFFLGIIVVLTFLTLAQCTVKKPQAPSWDTTFVVPVINRNYPMQELVDKIGQDEIEIDSLGNISFSLSEVIDPVGIDQSDFVTSDLSYTQSDVLGPITISAPSFNPFLVSLTSITGLSSSLPGDSGIVTPMSFTVFNDLPTITEFSQAEIATGQLDVSIANNLGIELDTTIIQIYDNQFAAVVTVDTLIFPFFSGTVLNHSISLNGVTVSNNLRVDVAAYTPGGMVHSVSTRDVSIDADFNSSLVVVSAIAQVPALADINLSEKIGINLDAGESIDSAQLSAGSMVLDITNYTGLDATLDVSIPSLELNGVPYAISQNLTPGQVYNINSDLANYNLIPSGDSVEINVALSIPGSGVNLVPVDAADSFAVNAQLSNLSFNSVSGVFPSNNVSFDNVQQDLDIPDGFDQVSFVTAILTLEVNNGVDLPGNLACTLNANTGNQLVVSGAIDASGTAATQLSTITNNNVAAFLNPLPESITISGGISFGDASSHTIYLSDSVFASVNIYAPLHVKVDNAFIDDLDIEREELDQNDAEKITDHVKEIRFIYEIENHLPLGVRAVVSLGPDSTALYSSPALVIDTFYADPAPVDGITGITTSALISTGEILLDSLDIQILKNDTLFIRPLLFLNTSDTSGVLLTENDYFTLQGRIEVEYTFDGEF